jgi:hypothetical protein
VRAVAAVQGEVMTPEIEQEIQRIAREECDRVPEELVAMGGWKDAMGVSTRTARRAVEFALKEQAAEIERLREQYQQERDEKEVALMSLRQAERLLAEAEFAN